MMFDKSKISTQQLAALIKLYYEQDLPLDKLPYTQQFDKIVTDFQKEFDDKHDHHFLYMTLIRLRKNGRLARKFRSKRKEQDEVRPHTFLSEKHSSKP